MRAWGQGISLLAVLTAMPGCFAFASLAAGKPAPENAATQEVRRLNEQEVQAMLHGDADVMVRLWSDDLVVTNPLNKFVTKKQVLDMVRSGFLVITSYDRQIEYMRDYGNVAIVAGHETVVWGGKMPNAGRTEHLRFTSVWMKQQGRWQQVARHANIVPQQ
jgi:uncharacterized protein (TIGR02246 family)